MPVLYVHEGRRGTKVRLEDQGGSPMLEVEDVIHRTVPSIGWTTANTEPDSADAWLVIWRPQAELSSPDERTLRLSPSRVGQQGWTVDGVKHPGSRDCSGHWVIGSVAGVV